MELTLGRLKAALIAGKIPVTDEALAILRAGLDTITHGYHLNRVLKGIKTETELKKDLARLYLACRTFVDVLDTDLNKGLGQIEAMLSATWPGIQLVRLVEELRGCSIPGVGRPDPFQGGDGVSNPLCSAGESGLSDVA